MIRIGIYGYGNLYIVVEAAIKKKDDYELIAAFTRRNPEDLKIATKTAKVISSKDVLKYKDNIDVMVLYGGSATNLLTKIPYSAQYFNCID